MEVSFRQNLSMSQQMLQTMKMSQNQIMAMKVLSMSSEDLRNEIYEKAEKNPALEIASDSLENGIKFTKNSQSGFSDNTSLSYSSKSGEIASQNFQDALENSQEVRETLSEHLFLQLNSMKLSQAETEICTKLINNLDKNGFHLLAPQSLLKKDDESQTEETLQKCMKILQNMDPVGICVRNFEESLFIQAKNKNLSDCTLFLLDGHFEFLDPPQIQKIQKKIQKTGMADFSAEQIEKAVEEIKALDPFPARNFGTFQVAFVRPDIKVEKIRYDYDNSEIEFSVNLTSDILPELKISSAFSELISLSQIQDGKNDEKAEKEKSNLRFAKDSVQNAKDFIENINYRQNTILLAAKEIVKKQKEFFRNGPGKLVPLRQKDLAQILQVHETTVSRLANEKYLECDWGIFPLSYFFTNSITQNKNSEKDSEPSESTESSSNSKESVKFAVKKLLEEHKDDKKQLSDQKISDLLAEKGIKIARRTVSKYRTELNLASSYDR